MYIYILTKNEIPFYVGKTSNIKGRLKTHQKKYGENISINIIDDCDYEDSKDLEFYYIDIYLKKGYILENKHIGKTREKTKIYKNNIINRKKLNKKEMLYYIFEWKER